MTDNFVAADMLSDDAVTPHASDATLLRRIGARILSEANDLKRTPDALAKDLGRPPEQIDQVIRGLADLDTARNLLMQMALHYPVSLSDLWVEPDDTDGGVIVMRADDSRQTARIFSRPDRSGSPAPYYEYRDTAMSRLAPYRPEWIKELRIVEDDDPENPDVSFNKGHLMHQLTYFIGEVNFYWIVGGQKYCRTMNTGDSCYITPYVPHSFASRNSTEPGLIIAVTYAGEVRHALDALVHFTPRSLDEIAGDLRDQTGAFAARVERCRRDESLSVRDLSDRLRETGINGDRAYKLATGGAHPVAGEMPALAAALGVREKDLSVTVLSSDHEVVTRRAGDNAVRPYPDGNRPSYGLRDLARTPHQPGLRGFELEILNSDAPPGTFRHRLHEYVYNSGETVFELHWGDGRSERLMPGDSAYIRPDLEHTFTGPAGGRLVMIRVPGKLTDSVLDEFAAFDNDGRGRVTGETTQWF